jgi:RND superfamily putative drug exporter
MISVFLAFAMNPDPTVKAIGLGLAVAVFLDATDVRMVLVPATMALMGNGNWWLPKWLDRILPHIDIEGGEGLEVDETPEPVAVPEREAA